VQDPAMTRWVRIVLGVVLGLILLWFGVVWTLQGLNAWRGTFMSGSSQWLTIGVILDVAAILLLVQSALLLRRRRVRG
jgi:predicted branched-subunit amino acid permease